MRLRFLNNKKGILPLLIAAGAGAALGGAAGFFGSKGKQSVNPYGTLNPEQVALTHSLGPELNTRATGDASQFQYGGQLNAPITEGELGVQTNANRINAIAGKTYGNIGEYDPTLFNKQFDEEIADPTYASYKRNVLPGIQEAMPGFSTARGNVTARGLQNTSDQLLMARNQAREAQKRLALDALTGASNYNVNAANIAAVPRLIQQAGLDKAYQNFIQANAQKSDSINQALDFLGISTGTVTNKPNTTGSILNGAIAGAGAAGSIASSFQPKPAPVTNNYLGGY